MSAKYTKQIVYFGQPATLACDGRCDKAWGIHGRPKHRFVPELTDPDDYAFLSDDELGKAPTYPRTSEGGDLKPGGPDDEKLNKWCARECERCWMSDRGKPDQTPKLPDFSRRMANKPGRRT